MPSAFALIVLPLPLLWVLLFAGRAPAQPSPQPLPAADLATGGGLQLEQAIALALARNPQALAARRSLAVSEAEILVAGAVPNPTLGLVNGEFLPDVIKTSFLFVQQTFELGGKRPARIAVAEGEVGVARARLVESLLDLRTRVRRAYSEAFAAGAISRSLAESEVGYGRLVDVAAQRFRLGDIPELDLIRARQELGAAQNELRAARAREAAAGIALSALIGRTRQEPPVELPPVSRFVLQVEQNVYLPQNPLDAQERGRKLNALIEMALANRPDLRTLNNRSDVVRFQGRLAEAQRTPDLTVGLGPRYEKEDITRWGLAASVGITLPVFYRQEGEIARAEARSLQLRTEREALVRQIEAEVESAYTRALAARQEQETFEDSLLPGALEIERIARLAYERGKSDLTVSINAQAAANLARRRYYQSLNDYQTALADLEKAVGLPLTTS